MVGGLSKVTRLSKHPYIRGIYISFFNVEVAIVNVVVVNIWERGSGLF